MKRIIAHLDMDAFFASVEEQKRPHLAGKPIVVGSFVDEHGKGRGVVSTANYKAREYGIHSAMPSSTAWCLSEEAKKQGKDEVVFLPVDFSLYNKVSENVANIIKKYSESIQQASVDEFYFDLSFAKNIKKAGEICKKIKSEIKATQKVTCSVGIAPNKLISKIAAGIKKPDGSMVVEENDVQNFLNPLGIRELPGIGPKTAEVFYKKDITVISDLLAFSKEELKQMLGKNGESIYDKSRGIDDGLIIQHQPAKSIGEQITFDVNSLDVVFIYGVFKKICESVFKKFMESEFSAFKTMAITVRFSDFQTFTTAKSVKGGIGKRDKRVFEIEALKLLLPYCDRQKNPKQKPIRLIGIRVERLEV